MENNKNKTILTEAYKINLEIDREREIYEELLSKSNNKSGLVKDALVMYLTLIKKGAYTSPFLNANTSDWDSILRNLSLDNTLGRPAQQVKQEVIQQYSSVQQTADTSKLTLSFEDEDEYENDDNDIDY